MSSYANNRFNDYIGIRFLEVHENGCTAILENREELQNSMDGVIHGGVTFTLADAVMGFAAAPHVGGVQQAVSVECKINYLRPARGPVLKAVSSVVRRGRKIIVMEAKVMEENGELVAVALGTYARVDSNS
jgi:acyl-CoA thioesterase